MIRAHSFVVMLAVLFLAAAVQATSALYVTDLEQAKLSTAVVAATVGTSHFEKSERYQTAITLTKIKVDEVLYGKAPSELIIEQMGGTLGKVTTYLPGDARFEANTRVVLFLRQVEGGWYLTAMEQSLYRVVGGRLERELGDGMWIRSPTGRLVQFQEPVDRPDKTIDGFRRLFQALQSGGE
jgi:hypothetical protein